MNLSNFIEDKDFATLWMAYKAGLSDDKARFVFSGPFVKEQDPYSLQDKLAPFMTTPSTSSAMVARQSGGGRVLTCYLCGEPGYIKPYCPNKNKKKTSSQGPQGSATKDQGSLVTSHPLKKAPGFVDIKRLRSLGYWTLRLRVTLCLLVLRLRIIAHTTLRLTAVRRLARL